jgi:hypothetical protein
MRRHVVAMAGLAVLLLVVSFTHADALTLSPGAIAPAINAITTVDKAACWRWGWHGWGWYPCWRPGFGYGWGPRWGWGPGWGWHRWHHWHHW